MNGFVSVLCGSVINGPGPEQKPELRKKQSWRRKDQVTWFHLMNDPITAISSQLTKLCVWKPYAVCWSTASSSGKRCSCWRRPLVPWPRRWRCLRWCRPRRSSLQHTHDSRRVKSDTHAGTHARSSSSCSGPTTVVVILVDVVSVSTWTSSCQIHRKHFVVFCSFVTMRHGWVK